MAAGSRAKVSASEIGTTILLVASYEGERPKNRKNGWQKAGSGCWFLAGGLLCFFFFTRFSAS